MLSPPSPSQLPDGAVSEQAIELSAAAGEHIDDVVTPNDVGYQFVPIGTPSRLSPMSSSSVKEFAAPHAAGLPEGIELVEGAIEHDKGGMNGDDDQQASPIRHTDDGDDDISVRAGDFHFEGMLSNAANTIGSSASDEDGVVQLGHHLLRCLQSASNAQHITALILPSCGLHDEDIAASLCSGYVLPHLFSIDLSDNLLQTFPTFILRRLSSPPAASPMAAASAGLATTKPTSPWVWNVARNHRMRLFPPMLLECEIMGSITLTGCMQLMPNVVVAGLKGLVCGEVYVPEHTDETAVFESMLGLLAINGRHVHKRRGLETSSGTQTSSILGPQHARKCEGHLQSLRRRYLPAPHTTTHFLALLLDVVRLQVDVRHVDHPRLLQKHLGQVEAAQERYVLHQACTSFSLRAAATHTFEPPALTHDCPLVDCDGEVLPNDIVMRFGVGTPITNASLILQQRPLSFSTWKRLLTLSEGSDENRLPFFDAAVCTLVGHAKFPDAFPRCLVLAFVERILEECLSQQTSAASSEPQPLRSDVLALCDTVECWPTLAFHTFCASLCGGSFANSVDAPVTHVHVMHAADVHAQQAGGHWTTRPLTTPLDLPLERVLLAAQALGIGNVTSAKQHGGSDGDEEVVIAVAIEHFAEMLNRFHDEQEMNQTTAAIAADVERQAMHNSDQQRYNRTKMLSRPMSSSVSMQPHRSLVLPSAQQQLPGSITQVSITTSVAALSASLTSSTKSPSRGGDLRAGGASSPAEQQQRSVVDEDALELMPVVHNGFLPMRVPSSTVGGTEVLAPAAHQFAERGGLSGGSYRLVDPRGASSTRLAQRHTLHKGGGSTIQNKRRLAATEQSPVPVREQEGSFDCLRPNTPATAISSLLQHPQDTSAATVRSAGSRGMPRAGSAASQYIGQLETRLLLEAQATRPPATDTTQSAISQPRRSRTLLEFLSRRGVLRLQSASAQRAIDHASHLDLSDLRQADEPLTLSFVSGGAEAQLPPDGDPRTANSKPPSPSSVGLPARATAGGHVQRELAASSTVDPATFGCTLSDYERAERLYATTKQLIHATSLPTLLGIVHKLLNVSHRQPGEVLRVFTSVVCEHALGEALRASTSPPTWCEWICRDLAARGELRADHAWVVDEVHMHSAFQLGKNHSAASAGSRTPPHPLQYSSEIVAHGTPGSEDYEGLAAPPLVVAVASTQRPLLTDVPPTKPSAQSTMIGPTTRTRLNDYARNDSALDRDLVALTKVVQHPTVLSVVQPKSIRTAPSGGHGTTTNITSDVTSVVPITAAPQQLVDRGAHPFTVRAQQVLERERIRSHIRAASATPEDTAMASAVKRSCSASLRPMRQPPPVATGREATDWVATNSQFLPTIVRDQLTGIRHKRR